MDWAAERSRTDGEGVVVEGDSESSCGTSEDIDVTVTERLGFVEDEGAIVEVEVEGEGTILSGEGGGACLSVDDPGDSFTLGDMCRSISGGDMSAAGSTLSGDETGAGVLAGDISTLSCNGLCFVVESGGERGGGDCIVLGERKGKKAGGGWEGVPRTDRNGDNNLSGSLELLRKFLRTLEQALDKLCFDKSKSCCGDIEGPSVSSN